jgi:predicted ribosomally synthesized peptide with nif11-like leader
MSEEQLKAFLEAVKANAGLQGKLNAAADANAAAAIAKEAGFMISADELQKAHAIGEELTDEELEGVAGGVGNQSQNYDCSVNTGDCGCFEVW